MSQRLTVGEWRVVCLAVLFVGHEVSAILLTIRLLAALHVAEIHQAGRHSFNGFEELVWLDECIIIHLTSTPLLPMHAGTTHLHHKSSS